MDKELDDLVNAVKQEKIEAGEGEDISERLINFRDLEQLSVADAEARVKELKVKRGAASKALPEFGNKIEAERVLRAKREEKKMSEKNLQQSIAYSEIGFKEENFKQVDALRTKYKAGTLGKLANKAASLGTADNADLNVPTSIEGAVKDLIKNFWKAERALGKGPNGGPMVIGGLPEGKTMLKKASGEIADKELKEKTAAFLMRDTQTADKQEKEADETLNKKSGQARINLRAMATQVASFFYSTKNSSDAWLEQAELDGLTEDEKALAEAAVKGVDASASASAADLRKKEEQILNDALIKPAADPLSVAEVPQFVRDTINAMYPLLADEIQVAAALLRAR